MALSLRSSSSSICFLRRAPGLQLSVYALSAESARSVEGRQSLQQSRSGRVCVGMLAGSELRRRADRGVLGDVLERELRRGRGRGHRTEEEGIGLFPGIDSFGVGGESSDWVCGGEGEQSEGVRRQLRTSAGSMRHAWFRFLSVRLWRAMHCQGRVFGRHNTGADSVPRHTDDETTRGVLDCFSISVLRCGRPVYGGRFRVVCRSRAPMDGKGYGVCFRLKAR
jgi:hypothetical protein